MFDLMSSAKKRRAAQPSQPSQPTFRDLVFKTDPASSKAEEERRNVEASFTRKARQDTEASVARLKAKFEGKVEEKKGKTKKGKKAKDKKKVNFSFFGLKK